MRKMDVILHRPIPDGFTLKQATLIRKADGGDVSFSLEAALRVPLKKKLCLNDKIRG